MPSFIFLSNLTKLCHFKCNNLVNSNMLKMSAGITTTICMRNKTHIQMLSSSWDGRSWAENWGLCPFGSPSNTMWPGSTPTFVPCSILIHLFGHNRHEPKIGGLCPFLGVGAGSPSNTMSPGPRPTSVPRGILIHPAIWLQTWAENWGGLCPLFGELGPHLTLLIKMLFGM